MRFLYSSNGVVLVGFLAVAGYFLWAEHSAHVVAYLPWILVGGCVVMHFFMHRGHNDHGTDAGPRNESVPRSGARHDKSTD